MKKKRTTTDNKRTVLTTTKKEIVFGPKRAEEIEVVNEEPRSARANKRNWDMWKFAEELNPEEIQFLITRRKEKLRYETNTDEVRNLRTDISILEDAYRIIKRRRKK